MREAVGGQGLGKSNFLLFVGNHVVERAVQFALGAESSGLCADLGFTLLFRVWSLRIEVYCPMLFLSYVHSRIRVLGYRVQRGVTPDPTLMLNKEIFERLSVNCFGLI